MPTLFIELDHFDDNPLTILELLEPFSRVDHIYFPLHLDKMEKEAKLFGKDKLLLLLAYRIEDQFWNFATV